MFGFFKTPTEQSRDQYYNLYQDLKDCESYHDKKVTEARETFNSYKSSVPNFSNSKVPSKDFDTKREQLTTDLETYINEEASKKSDLTAAKKKAKEQYEHYKNMAVAEAKEKKRKEDEKLKKELEDLKKGLGI